MTPKNSGKIVSAVHPICCGLDVHKDMVSACIIITEPDGKKEPQPGTNALQVEACF